MFYRKAVRFNSEMELQRVRDLAEALAATGEPWKSKVEAAVAKFDLQGLPLDAVYMLLQKIKKEQEDYFSAEAKMKKSYVNFKKLYKKALKKKTPDVILETFLSKVPAYVKGHQPLPKIEEKFAELLDKLYPASAEKEGSTEIGDARVMWTDKFNEALDVYHRHHTYERISSEEFIASLPEFIPWQEKEIWMDKAWHTTDSTTARAAVESRLDEPKYHEEELPMHRAPKTTKELKQLEALKEEEEYTRTPRDLRRTNIPTAYDDMQVDKLKRMKGLPREQKKMHEEESIRRKQKEDKYKHLTPEKEVSSMESQINFRKLAELDWRHDFITKNASTVGMDVIASVLMQIAAIEGQSPNYGEALKTMLQQAQTAKGAISQRDPKIGDKMQAIETFIGKAGAAAQQMTGPAAKDIFGSIRREFANLLLRLNPDLMRAEQKAAPVAQPTTVPQASPVQPIQ